MKAYRLMIILAAAAFLLLIPFIGMQFTKEVNWSLSDFAIAGLLLFGTGLSVEFTLRKSKNRNFRTFAIIAIVIISLLIWVELAVGIFGTPFAGS
jgi:hypothetical protein